MFLTLDGYMKSVLADMKASYPPCDADGGSPDCLESPLVSWVDNRDDPTKNCDPSSTPPIPEGASLTRIIETLPDLRLNSDFSDEDQSAVGATVTLGAGPIELCIAEQLRHSAPGASGASELLLSDAEQRELLEVTREHAQAAMLDYAQLASVVASPLAPSVEAPPPDVLDDGAVGILSQSQYMFDGQRLPLIQQWALEPDNAPFLVSFGQDFATAVQLDIAVTNDLAQLMARSRSAGTPSSSVSPNNRADQIWSTESWQQRLMALMYGGDPLAITGNTPWQSPLATGPDFGRTTSSYSNIYGYFPGLLEYEDQSGFPNEPVNDLDLIVLTDPFDEFPWNSRQLPVWSPYGYISNEVTEPEVFRALGLLRQFNLLSFKLTAGSGCQPIDASGTAGAWMSGLETALYNQLCNTSSNPFSVVPGDTNPSYLECLNAAGGAVTGVSQENTLLWTRYHITQTHLMHLAGWLSDGVGQYAGTSGNCTLGQHAVYDLIGNAPVTIGGTNLQLDSSTQFLPLDLRETAPIFTRIESLGFFDASTLVAEAHAGTQAFDTLMAPNPQSTFALSWTSGPPFSFVAERKRRMGALSALQAVREQLVAATIQTNAAADGRQTRLSDYLAPSGQILDLIDAAIGDSGVSVVPLFAEQTASDGTKYMARSDPDWSVSVTAPVGDPFWNSSSAAEAIVAVPSSEWAANIIRAAEITGDPSHVSLPGGTPATLLSAAATAASIGTAFGQPDGNPTPTRELFSATLGLAASASPSGYWTIFAVRGDPSVIYGDFSDIAAAANSLQYRLIAENFRAPPNTTNTNRTPYMEDKALYLSTGGKFGTWLTRQVTPSANNPVLPAYDGFELPQNWVPPFNAGLLGGDPSQSSISFLLNQATSTAASARDAVNTAYTDLIQAQQDQSSLSAAEQSSDLQLHQAAQALCGTVNAACSVPTPLVQTVSRSWYPSLANVANIGASYPSSCDTTLQNLSTINDETAAEGAVDCILEQRITRFLQQQVALAEPVGAQLAGNVVTVPTFNDYAGGTLQSDFIAQFTALKAPDALFSTLTSQTAAVKQAMKQAQAALAAAAAETKTQCGTAENIQAFFGAANAAYQGAQAGAIAGPVGSFLVGAVDAISFWASHEDECKAAEKNETAARQAAITAMLDGFAAVVATTQNLTNAEAAIAQSGATIQRDVAEEKMAVAQDTLEQTLAGAGQRSTLGMYREYTSADLWQAKALLESSRRFALTARRAIESQYVVNLSDMTSDEPFVAAPSTWADEIYDYDLSLPAAVGLTLSDPTAQGALPSKVLDYVGNLQSFLSGYSVNRPTAVAQSDIDVLYIPGTWVGTSQTIAESQSDGGVTDTTVYPDAGNWSVLCGKNWVAGNGPTAGGVAGTCTDWTSPTSSCVTQSCAVGDIDCAITAGCYVAPDAAQISFGIDPWGRMNGFFADTPLTRRYNARWSKLAVNLVGSGVIDCSNASDPLVCYSQSYVGFNLTHGGPALVTDYAERWNALAIPDGQIEAGKALAAEVVLDPLKDGWDSSDIAPVARTEFSQRPLGGQYTLQIQAGPTVRLDHVERIQLLVGQSYWVGQQ